jgi:DNA repair exonuclease SbcCD ATPase subunit
VLDDSRESEARALQELKDANEAKIRALQELENVKLDLASYKHYLRMEEARSERLGQDLEEKKDLIARLKKRLETAERNSKMGANRPRLIREPDTDLGPEDRRRR